MDYYDLKPWDKFEPDSNRPVDILREVARHMELAHRAAANPSSLGFKAGHQLAHKGWAFPAGVYDVATGTTYPGIKGLRALILAGRYDWFSSAAWSQGQVSTLSEIVDAGTQQFVQTLTQGNQFITYSGRDYVIVVVDRGGTPRVAGVILENAEQSGLTPHFEAAVAARSGCMLPATALILTLAVAVVAAIG
jgi:hypothetical protein